VAYDHVVHTIPAYGAVVYLCAERLCRESISSRTVVLFFSPAASPLLSQFANVHDVSWGTKGDNKVSTDLGVVTTAKNSNQAEVSVPTEEKDIDAAYEDALHVLNTKPPKQESKPDAGTKQEDYYRQFRTKWVFCCFHLLCLRTWFC
jgi:hypothetical protein